MLELDVVHRIVEIIEPVRVVRPALQLEEEELTVRTYAVDARVSGTFARVSTEFSLYNPNGRVMEAELEFPLPAQACVCGYALDINGEMIDGQVVEKEKARIAFEAEVKKGVDPGLAEHVRGNLYRTRVYPVPAGGARRVRVDYVAPLATDAEGNAALFLPMPLHRLDRRDVVISVNIPGAPAPVIGGLGNRRFEAAESLWRVESHETDVAPEDHLLVGLPVMQDAVSNVEEFDGDRFFMASVRVPAVEAAAGEVPKNWRILWDASGSREEVDHGVEKQLLALLPEKASFELVVFSNVAEAPLRFDSREELLSAIDRVIYDGGTDFSVLEPLAREPFDGVTLVFSDGLDTVSGRVPELGAGAMAVLSGTVRDTSAMRRMCGGRSVDFGMMVPQEAMRQILSPDPVVAAVRGEGISDVQGIGLPATGRVSVLGRLQGDEADISVVLSDGRSFPVHISAGRCASSKTNASAWAARRVDELSADAESHRSELLAIGRHFCIASPVSSLIVFERLEQWLEYNIEPPRAMKELHDEWMKRHKSEDRIESERREAERSWQQKIESEWMERVKWWNNPVPKRQFVKSGVFDDERGPLGVARRVIGRAADAVAGMIPPRGASAGGRGGVMRSRVPENIRVREEECCDEVACRAPEPDMASANMVMDMPAPGAMPGMMGMPAPGAMPGMMGMPAPGAMPGMMGMPAPGAMPGLPDGGASASASASESASASASASASVSIKAWDPETPYLTAIRDSVAIFSGQDSAYREYLKQRKAYRRSPAFFLDCAGYFFKMHENAHAIRILSNLSELKLEDTALLRVYAWRLREADELDASIRLLRKIADMRADEAVSWRDLALTLVLRAKKNMDAADATEALELFKKAAFTPWPRSDALWTSLVALEEFNAFAAWCSMQKWKGAAPVVPVLDEKYRKVLDTDLRIVLMWDADNTDIDLHVLEPSGEEVFYSHPLSQTGGMISHDVTTGYGPEEFLHKKAPAGEYVVMSNYFASHQQKLTGPVTVTATVFTNWGRMNEESQTLSLRLDRVKDKHKIGTIEFK